MNKIKRIYDTGYDDTHGGFIIVYETQCSSCKHILPGCKCKAFPDGIFNAILTGSHDHRTPYKGDNGILYEQKDSKTAGSHE